MLESTPYNRHGSARFDVQKGYAGTSTIRNARSLLFPFHSSRALLAHGRAQAIARLSRVVTAALLSEVAEIVALPDLRPEASEDRVRDRDVKEKVG